MHLPGLGENGAEEKSIDSPGRGVLQSDTDRTRSPSPAAAANSWLSKPPNRGTGPPLKFTGFRNENIQSITRPDFEKQQPTARLILKTKMENAPDSSSPAPPGSAQHPVLHPRLTYGFHHRRSRPETSHQKAVNINRKMRIENIIHKKLVTEQKRVRREKRQETSTYGFRAMSRIINLPEDYDTEDEGSWGPGGLVPNPNEQEDYGGEALRHKKVVDRAIRRLAREGQTGSLTGLGQSLNPRKRKSREYDDNDRREGNRNQKRSKSSGGQGLRPTGECQDKGSQEDGLDDLDLDLLGESRDEHGEEDMDDESGADDTEEGDDETEEDGREDA